jgi:hypothetical protein
MMMMMTIILLLLSIVTNISLAASSSSCTVDDYIANTPSCPNECAQCEAMNWDPDDISCQRCFCATTKRMPSRPIVGYGMCHMYNSRSCCIPVFDAEIQEHFEILLDAGDRCALELREQKNRLRELFCLACSPKQPLYLVNGTLQICKSFAESVNPTLFDACGMVKVAERGTPSLGDDSVLPSLEWDGYESFINDACGAKPPFLEDFGVHIVDDSVEGHGICYGSTTSSSSSSSVSSSSSSPLFLWATTTTVIFIFSTYFS